MRYYSEYLPNVGQVSVSFDESGGGEVSVSDTSVLIAKNAIPLPAEIVPTQVPPVGPLGTLRFRAGPLATVKELKKTETIASIHTESPYNPTFVRSLPKDAELCNLEGKDILTSPLDSFRLRNMPSEHWAEMMDFWHCHKPHDKSEQFNPAYAVSQFKPKAGEILFGQEYIMVNKADLGDPAGGKEEGDSVKIPKWNLQFKSAESTVHVDPVQVMLFSMSELTNSHASHQFLLCDETKSDAEVQPAALVWIFNKNLTYTLSGIEGREEGSKVYYTLDPALISQLSKDRDQVEQVFYPKWVVDTFVQKLEKSNELLPEQSKKFIKWNMGLLRLD
ncbi:hypothetical protein CJU89_6391 [Yarrowia sp. B02]|nr:hypothetical protein CJU89_6391 [Yarrowia sp. B02]